MCCLLTLRMKESGQREECRSNPWRMVEFQFSIQYDVGVDEVKGCFVDPFERYLCSSKLPISFGILKGFLDRAWPCVLNEIHLLIFGF